MKPVLAVGLLMMLLAACSTTLAKERRDEVQGPVRPDLIFQGP